MDKLISKWKEFKLNRLSPFLIEFEDFMDWLESHQEDTEKTPSIEKTSRAWRNQDGWQFSNLSKDDLEGLGKALEELKK